MLVKGNVIGNQIASTVGSLMGMEISGETGTFPSVG